ncbi:hypothetical protein E3N88_03846 [Mikania micrantha]|uniref:C2H2-type domain-containing protein n=1 Tax=Mikania micrantha TaxID=192012 RepID=A0A5N6PUS9_9ASTR|nr:hypothetical protein E3N88_03846 [Mikania micrantha]
MVYGREDFVGHRGGGLDNLVRGRDGGRERREGSLPQARREDAELAPSISPLLQFSSSSRTLKEKIAFSCKACQLTFASVFHLSSHVESQQHKVNISQMKKRREAISNPIWCELCRSSCSSLGEVEAHLVGSKHNSSISNLTKNSKRKKSSCPNSIIWVSDFDFPSTLENVCAINVLYGRFILSPLMKGQADTIGIAMQSALLGEIEGTCITRAKSEKISHEYSTIMANDDDGVYEKSKQRMSLLDCIVDYVDIYVVKVDMKHFRPCVDLEGEDDVKLNL